MSPKRMLQIALVLTILVACLSFPRGASAWGGCGSTYVVQPGDWLSRIAARCGVSLSALYAANPWAGYYRYIYPGPGVGYSRRTWTWTSPWRRVFLLRAFLQRLLWQLLRGLPWRYPGLDRELLWRELELLAVAQQHRQSQLYLRRPVHLSVEAN